MHAQGSKYLSNAYGYRTTLYRPMTRTMVRKAEAHTASAFFSNEDVVSVAPQDDDDPFQNASADVMKELLQYRLTNSIPWFQTVVGARQDAEVHGICVAKAYWKYSEKNTTERQFRLDESGQVMRDPLGVPITWDAPAKAPDVDQPVIDLIAPENFRIEPGADWRQPIETSPYIIQLIPMYIQDIEEKIASGEWLPVASSALRNATDLDDDVTRRTRELGRVPGKDADAWKPRPFDIAWARENIVRWGGRDWHFMSVGMAGELLTEPRPLEEVYLHGMRPYVMGAILLETHKTYATSKIELVRDLQRAANDDWNLRFDNLKLVLNPRQFVKIGQGIEVADVRSFMPGKVVLTKDPVNDIKWDRPPAPDSSAYAEQDRINLDFDNLTGDFSNTSVQSNQQVEQTATGMNLMSSTASIIPEYELRLFAETFIEPLLKQLIKLEQAYETDPVILAIAGNRAQLFQKYGVSEITDTLLNQSLTTKVNVGVGATNPKLKLQNFAEAADLLSKIFGPTLVQGINFEEVVKEIMGLAGYKDGSRFFQQDFNPQVAQLKQQLTEAQKKGGNKASAVDPSFEIQKIQMQQQGDIQEAQIRAQTDQANAQAKLHEAQLAEASENYRSVLAAHKEMLMQGRDHAHQHALAHANAQRQMPAPPPQNPFAGPGV